MESLDENQLGEKAKLSVPYQESYIKAPFNVWKWMLIVSLTCGVIGGATLIYMEFIYFPANIGNIDWREYESFQMIAETTGVAVNTLISRKRYAVLYLREELKELFEIIKA